MLETQQALLIYQWPPTDYRAKAHPDTVRGQHPSSLTGFMLRSEGHKSRALGLPEQHLRALDAGEATALLPLLNTSSPLCSSPTLTSQEGRLKGAGDREPSGWLEGPQSAGELGHPSRGGYTSECS